MRTCRYRRGIEERWGLLEGEAVRPLSAEPWAGGLPEGRPVPLAEVVLLAPVRPGKVVCVGRNYVAHARELGNEVPKEPLLFLKPSTAVIGPQEAIVCPPQSKDVQHEAELGVVVGRALTRATAAEAKQAEKLFVEAMAKFQSECPVIKKTKVVKGKDKVEQILGFWDLDSGFWILVSGIWILSIFAESIFSMEQQPKTVNLTFLKPSDENNVPIQVEGFVAAFRAALDQCIEIGGGVAVTGGDEADERGVRLGKGGLEAGHCLGSSQLAI